MAWYRNHYKCGRCGHKWPDEWSCMCDDDCPSCGARHMTQDKSDDLTTVVHRNGSEFVVLSVTETAEHDADYRELGRFPKRTQASAS